jgi:hypothetical protein
MFTPTDCSFGTLYRFLPPFLLYDSGQGYDGMDEYLPNENETRLKDKHNNMRDKGAL